MLNIKFTTNPTHRTALIASRNGNSKGIMDQTAIWWNGRVPEDAGHLINASSLFESIKAKHKISRAAVEILADEIKPVLTYLANFALFDFDLIINIRALTHGAALILDDLHRPVKPEVKLVMFASPMENSDEDGNRLFVTDSFREFNQEEFMIIALSMNELFRVRGISYHWLQSRVISFGANTTTAATLYDCDSVKFANNDYLDGE